MKDPILEIFPDQLPGPDLREEAGSALYRSLYDRIRQAILEGRPGFEPGRRLPPSRSLASSLGISRNTVVSAYEQLLAEGYIEGRTGAGTFVADLPRRDSIQRGGRNLPGPGLSERGKILARIPVSRRKPLRDVPAAVPFQPGVPDLAAFPFAEMSRIAARCLRSGGVREFGYGAVGGLLDLRRAIAVNLRLSRGVIAEPERILIVNGSQEALYLCARLLSDPGDRFYVEDPGYPGARGAFAAAGANITPVPVDREGLDVAELRRVYVKQNAGRRCLVYCTPSHQFPLGVPLSLRRRLELLQFAAEANAFILEDDYDSEFRYSGRPLTALSGLSDVPGTSERTIYIGTFSKIMAPGLRLGYLVIPEPLVDAFLAARALIDRQPPALNQMIVARFMQDGGYHRHVRRMRELYGERRAILLDALREKLAGRLEPLIGVAGDTGLHVAATLSGELQGTDDQKLADNLVKRGLNIPPLSGFLVRPRKDAPRGFMMGYAPFEAAAIRAGVEQMAVVL